jgi:7,8-dihydro-6-hydroxymethylpterin-pyrophosphokinase
LLALAKDLETRAGRAAGPRWGPRPLDVDVLLAGECVIHEAELEIPHPRLRERAFVLAPLAAVAPELRVPEDGRTAGELLAALPHPLLVERTLWTWGRGLPPP